MAYWRGLKTDKRTEKSKAKPFYFTMNDEHLDTASKDSYDFKITRFVCTHKINKDFHKTIILVTHREDAKLPLIFIQSYFDRKVHDLESAPCHGNSLKKYKLPHSTKSSARNNIHKLLTQGLNGKEIF